jgi:hypothetical protein
VTRYAKAVVAFFTTTGGVIATVYADQVVHLPEVLIGICTVGAATFGVYLMPNTPPDGEPRDPAMSETAKPAA